MAAQKVYPGGFKLTKKTAAALAVQELGTARGMEQERGMPDGWFAVTFGNLVVDIHPDVSGCMPQSLGNRIQMVIRMTGSSAKIVQFFDKDTLEQDFVEDEVYRKAHSRELLKDWVEGHGSDYCHKKIDEIWNEG